MKKKFGAILMVLVLVILLFVGCGSDNSVVKETLSEEELHDKLEAVYNQACSVNDDCEELTALIIDGWKKSNFERDYFDYDEFNEYRMYYNEGYIATVERVHKLRENIPQAVSSVQDALKEYSDYSDDSYYQAIKELYLSLDAFSEFAIVFPEGYSLITYTSKYNNHREEFSDLKSSAEFEK